MTSEERREGRYQRRCQRRAAKKEVRRKEYDDFQQVFSYEHLYQSYRLCRRNVAWKSSVQKYITQAPLRVYQTYEKLHRGTWKSGGFFEFDINERGKVRHIRSVTMEERVVQRCLCDNALVPALRRTFVYDNAASLKDRGYHFAIRRCRQHLREHYRKHGREGYVLLFDFSKFFDRISHELCREILRREFSDHHLIGLTEHFIDMFGDTGLGLGSQISQIFALASANRLDHYIKEVLRIRGYGRYMDDGYLIHESKEYLQQCLAEIRRICARLGITINEKKTQIVRLRHGFTFLQAKFNITESGKVVQRISRKSVTRERRRMKKHVRLLNEGIMDGRDVFASFQSWRAYAQHFFAHRTIRNMGNLYDQLFIGSGWSGC